MIKFITILVSLLSLNTFFTFGLVDSKDAPQPVEVEFSGTAVAIESGQPVFEKGTDVWVSNPGQEEVQIFLNEQETESNSEKIELSKIILIGEGTYTLVIQTSDEEKTFGFTIQ